MEEVFVTYSAPCSTAPRYKIQFILIKFYRIWIPAIYDLIAIYVRNSHFSKGSASSTLKNPPRWMCKSFEWQGRWKKLFQPQSFQIVDTA